MSENRLGVRLNRLGLALALVLGLGATSACDTAEERAENHYQSGLALLEEGDVERALVEFRNVFKLNGKHKDARLTYARVQRERGFLQQSYSQYLRLVEQYPDNLEGRRALSEMALATRNYEEVERHVTKAQELAPDDRIVQSVANTLAYFHSIRDKDESAREAAVIKAQALVSEDETLGTSREIVIDDLIRKQDWYAALDAIDDGLAVDPDNKSMYRVRIGVLQQLGNTAALEAQLRDLITRFPEDKEQFKQALIQFYVSQNELGKAETFLREVAAADDATTAERGLLVRFLEQYRGKDAALEEVENIIAQDGTDKSVFRAVRAQLVFERGDRDEAIAEMEDLLQGAERTPETRGIEINLARMLFAEDNAVGARALVEKVLAEDRSQPDAVKLKANWLIEDDETGDAIVMLRDALGQTPQDADLMTLMAKAHEREGNRELMLEMLTLAVQASNKAPGESMRYATVLAADDKLRAAESVLIDALRLQPKNLALLFQLGSLYIQMEDWSRTDGVIRALNEEGSDKAKTSAKELTARTLFKQQRSEELTQLLEGMTEDPELAANARVALLRTRISTEGPEAGLEYLETLLEGAPTDSGLLFVKGGLLASTGKPDEAEEIFRNLLEENPKRPQVWMTLYRMKTSQQKPEEASEILKQALEATPDNPNLLWARAGELEQQGDAEGAIAIYEQLYERSSSSLILANNLASLLADNRDDAESLQRAYTIARRLRDADLAAFQDTYGWISYRRGNKEEAVEYLEKAAASLTDEVSVQYHLAVAYAGTGETEKALEYFRKAAALVDADNPPPYADTIQSEIARLEAGTEAPKE
ncbi:tetratricopeptide repeat protein [Arenibacterium sp. CAU 1754]